MSLAVAAIKYPDKNNLKEKGFQFKIKFITYCRQNSRSLKQLVLGSGVRKKGAMLVPS